MTWSKEFDRCQTCGTTEKRHKAHGLCQSCILVWRYWNCEKDRERWKANAKAAYLREDADQMYRRNLDYRRRHPERVREYKRRWKAKVRQEVGYLPANRRLCKGRVVKTEAGYGECVSDCYRFMSGWRIDVRIDKTGEIWRLDTREVVKP